jgi:oxalate decarboxylase/phosphoglucose isomerase-like protein (cupin superfamily)
LSGKRDYYLDEVGTTKSIAAGNVVVPIEFVHSVMNSGDEPLIFISVVSPADVGYQFVTLEGAFAVHLYLGEEISSENYSKLLSLLQIGCFDKFQRSSCHN